MRSIVAFNPFQCRMWDMHDRFEGHITEESCKDEIQSFCKHGQLVPALGRPLKGDLPYKVELIYGARRLFVARHLNVPLLVELREMTDIEALVSMDIENRQRTDISAYERGQSYARFLRTGHFRSQDEIARMLKISASQVSRLLKLAQLPPVIVNAFASAADICEGWGLEIIQALEDPARRARTVAAARSIAEMTPRPSAREVYRMLTSPTARGSRMRSPSRDEVVKDKHGTALFRIRQQRSSTVILLTRVMAPAALEAVRNAVAEALQKHETGLRPPSVLELARARRSARAFD